MWQISRLALAQNAAGRAGPDACLTGLVWATRALAEHGGQRDAAILRPALVAGGSAVGKIRLRDSVSFCSRLVEAKEISHQRPRREIHGASSGRFAFAKGDELPPRRPWQNARDGQPAHL